MPEPERRMPKLAAVIVSWNAKDYLRECLRALFDGTRNCTLEVYVVDNGSSDGTAAMVRESFPEVRLTPGERNVGFAAANNIALAGILKDKSTDFVLLINADVEAGEGTIEGLVEELERSPEAGAAAPALILPTGSFQAGAAGFLPGLASGLNYFLFFGRFSPFGSGSLFINQALFARRKENVRVEWLSGACLLLKRKAIEAAGLLDERYFFCLEDIDLGKRLGEKGFDLLYVPRLKVLHHHGISYKTILREINTEWLRLLFAYVRREKGRGAAAGFRAAAALGFFLRLLGRSVLAIAGTSPERWRRLKETAAFFSFSLTGRGRRAINAEEDPSCRF